MAKNKFTFHEDFSGAGMARLGLGSAWKCLRACDFNSKKCAVYRDNFPQNNLFEGDISDVSIKDAKAADLAWASFPCQDTSLAGGYAGLAGERSGTFWAWWRIVEGMKKAGKPYKILCIENVRGLLTSNNGTDFAAICEALAQAGYVFGAAVVDAAYFLPQSRERIFIVGVRGSKDLINVFSVERNPLWHPESMIAAYENLTAKAKEKWFWLNPPKPKSKRKRLSTIIKEDSEGVSWNSAAETSKLIAMMSPENYSKLMREKEKGKRVIGMLYKRIRNGKQQAEIRFDGTAGCLRTAKGGSSRQTVIVVNGGNVRSRLLAPREAASLMGLPKSYKLPKTYNDAYNLCGDGVAVPVVRFLARTVFVPALKAMETDEP
jgi:DNA (cytosine-5)-methyltransferase 1